jgi:hypothetical protein
LYAGFVHDNIHTAIEKTGDNACEQELEYECLDIQHPDRLHMWQLANAV